MRTLCFFILSSFSFPVFSSLKISVFDTNFCPEKFKNLIVTDFSLETTKLKSGCQTHGQKILRYLDKKISKKIEVHTYSVFDQEGRTRSELWKKMIERYKQQRSDLTLVAVGISDKEIDLKVKKLFQQHPSLKFVASGQVGKGIGLNAKLFPQSLFEDKKITLVGGYFLTLRGKKHYPKYQLNSDKIEAFYEIDGSEIILGSSQAAANALVSKIKELSD